MSEIGCQDKQSQVPQIESHSIDNLLSLTPRSSNIQGDTWLQHISTTAADSKKSHFLFVVIVKHQQWQE